MTPGELVAQCLTGRGVIAVTGATGWFGATALDLLYAALGDSAPERVVGYASAARDVTVADGRVVRVRPLSELGAQSPAPETVLHFAYLTRDRVEDLGVDAYSRRNIAISATVLDAIARHRPRHVVMASSGAVYGPGPRLVADVDNDPYGTLKHLDELAFRSACADVGASCVIPRVFSVAGPRMTKPDKYALGSMIAMAERGGPIEVRAAAPVHRSYCGVDEVVALALWAAVQGRDLTLDSGGTVVEVGELAEVVADVLGLGPGSVARAWDPSGPANTYVGDGARMSELADEAGLDLRSLPELVGATAAWLSGQQVGTP
jgi:nucleoside-diphosphate-sugar epimerase